MKPGKILFTVTPNGPSSIDNVFAQLAIAARIVLDTPNPAIGTFTEVESTLMIRPDLSCFMPGKSVRKITCEEST